eukprot:649522-Prorocentrum_lima.AAC.1
MTSSLVGSEMCIRDRPYKCNMMMKHGPNMTWAIRYNCLDRKTKQWFARPVSYTHLTLPTICSV